MHSCQVKGILERIADETNSSATKVSIMPKKNNKKNVKKIINNQSVNQNQDSPQDTNFDVYEDDVKIIDDYINSIITGDSTRSIEITLQASERILKNEKRLHEFKSYFDKSLDKLVTCFLLKIKEDSSLQECVDVYSHCVGEVTGKLRSTLGAFQKTYVLPLTIEESIKQKVRANVKNDDILPKFSKVISDSLVAVHRELILSRFDDITFYKIKDIMENLEIVDSVFNMCIEHYCDIYKEIDKPDVCDIAFIDFCGKVIDKESVILSHLSQQYSSELSNFVSDEVFGKSFLTILNDTNDRTLLDNIFEEATGESMYKLLILCKYDTKLYDLLIKKLQTYHAENVTGKDFHFIYNYFIKLHRHLIYSIEHEVKEVNSIEKAFFAFICKNSYKLASDFVDFIHEKLTSGQKFDFMNIFRFIKRIECFDAFISCYQCKLAQRILSAKELNLDTELCIVSFIDEHSGCTLLKQMFDDYFKSKVFSSQFDTSDLNIETNVLIIDNSSWPTYQYVNVVLPDQFQDLINKFRKYHQLKYKTKLTFYHLNDRVSYKVGETNIESTSAELSVLYCILHKLPIDDSLNRYKDMIISKWKEFGVLDKDCKFIDSKRDIKMPFPLTNESVSKEDEYEANEMIRKTNMIQSFAFDIIKKRQKISLTDLIQELNDRVTDFSVNMGDITAHIDKFCEMRLVVNNNDMLSYVST